MYETTKFDDADFYRYPDEGLDDFQHHGKIWHSKATLKNSQDKENEGLAWKKSNKIFILEAKAMGAVKKFIKKLFNVTWISWKSMP